MPHLIDLIAQPHSPESRLKVVEAELAKIDLLVKPTKKTQERRAALEAELATLQGKRLAKVYAIPPNRYLRLIEFVDGSYGQMECRPTSRLRPGWNVVVQPHPGREGMWSLVKEWP